MSSSHFHSVWVSNSEPLSVHSWTKQKWGSVRRMTGKGTTDTERGKFTTNHVALLWNWRSGRTFHELQPDFIIHVSIYPRVFICLFSRDLLTQSWEDQRMVKLVLRACKRRTVTGAEWRSLEFLGYIQNWWTPYRVLKLEPFGLWGWWLFFWLVWFLALVLV